MQQQTDNPPRLENFPISFFAMVMGFAGLTIAWEKAQHLTGMELHISPLLVGVTATLFRSADYRFVVA